MFPFFSRVALFLVSLHLAHSCSPSPTPATQCPPFASAPPFPFSAAPGCGHPSFRIKCASPHSLISINNVSFALLHFDPNSTSLTLSPQSSATIAAADTSSNCSSLQIPDRSIDFAGSPFRISDASCARLSILRPCSPPILPNCSRCPWQCRLVKRPLELFRGCAATHHLAEQGCQGDVLDYLGDMITRFGVQVEWDEAQDSYFSSCRDCETNNGVCGFNASDPNRAFVCFHSKSRISPPWIRVDKTPDRIAILSSILTLTCVFVLISIAITVFRSRRFGTGSIKEDPTALFLNRHRSTSPLPPVFTYEELEASTNKFDPKRKIGDGGFGSVYVGQLYDGRIVAVKHLHKHQTAAAATVGNSFLTKSFCNEILILSSINHPNLVKLHGYCSDRRGLLLVHDYVPNGTLADHLHGGKSLCIRGPLTWPMRLEIALQIALAMEYLHFSVIPPIVHRDITSSNIFVERDMRIKVGDFGLSRLLVVPETTSTSVKSEFVWTGPQGTPGYLDPEYHRSFRLTEKSDVYSFGVVLLELISGMKAVDQRREKRELALADLVVAKIQMGLLGQVVDPVVAAEEGATEGVKAAAELAFRCVAADKDDRPDAREVVEELRRIRNKIGGSEGDIGNR